MANKKTATTIPWRFFVSVDSLEQLLLVRRASVLLPRAARPAGAASTQPPQADHAPTQSAVSRRLTRCVKYVGRRADLSVPVYFGPGKGRLNWILYPHAVGCDQFAFDESTYWSSHGRQPFIIKTFNNLAAELNKIFCVELICLPAIRLAFSPEQTKLNSAGSTWTSDDLRPRFCGNAAAVLSFRLM